MIVQEVMEGTIQPIPEVAPLQDVFIRYTMPQDGIYLREWLSYPEAMAAYPMANTLEVDDATRRWVSFSRLRSSLTLEHSSGTIVGISTLHIHWYKRLHHQCDFAIIVNPEWRGKGAGSYLLSSLMKLAKQQFHIDFLHLQVYYNNPAIHLYSRFGFSQFGQHPAWIKDEDRSYTSVIYMGRRL